MNRNLLLTATAIGVLCGLWAFGAPLVGLSIWAGFAGCTTYFACGRRLLPGLGLTLATTLVGVLTALAMIWLGDVIGAPAGTGIAVGLIVIVIVLMGAVPWLAFVPGIFAGCYSTFAIDADWRLLGLSLIAGALLGLACDWAGEQLVKVAGTKEPGEPAEHAAVEAG